MLTAAIAIASKALGVVLGLLGRIPAVGWLVLALAAWGWHGQRTAETTRAEKTAAIHSAAITATKASEAARATEQAAHKANLKVTDELIKTRNERDAAARTAALRLRKLADAPKPTPALTATATSCRGYDGPAIDVIPEQAREDLIEQALEADQVADRLRACQAYVRTVVQPTP